MSDFEGGSNLVRLVPPEQLWEIIQTVAEDDSTWHNDVNGEMLCPFCTGFQTQEQWLTRKEPFPHTEECIVTKARACMALRKKAGG